MPRGVCPIHGCRLVRRNGKKYRAWTCPEFNCDYATRTLGVIPRPLRAIRKKAHDVFDAAWRGPQARITRSDAYHCLSVLLDVPKDEAHIGLCTAEQCKKIIQAFSQKGARK